MRSRYEVSAKIEVFNADFENLENIFETNGEKLNPSLNDRFEHYGVMESTLFNPKCLDSIVPEFGCCTKVGHFISHHLKQQHQCQQRLEQQQQGDR